MTTADLRRLIASLDNGAWGEEPDSDGTEIRCVRAADFDFTRFRARVHTAPLRKIAPAQQRRLALNRGDLILEKSGGGEKQVVGRAVLYDTNDDAVCSNFAARLRPASTVDSRYLTYLLAALYFDGATARCVLQTTGIQNLDADAWLQTQVPVLLRDEQRRIADFLDDQVARIDNIIVARSAQTSLVEEAEATSALEILSAGDQQDRRATGLGWLPSVPSAWPMASVHAGYSVQLGKMLDESKFTGAHAIPYLRNTNVQWDRITTDDLKIMDIPPGERERFTVRAGDLLICEGGQPGRSAVWDGSIAVLGYQKALHRARPRNDNDVRWLQLVLRVAVRQKVFGVEFGQATIGHLTGEQLRALRLPMPTAKVQRSRAIAFADVQSNLQTFATQLQRSIIKLDELKRSLITAAVTGEFDVSSADGSRVPIG